jgi:hypothetical protein
MSDALLNASAPCAEDDFGMTTSSRIAYPPFDLRILVQSVRVLEGPDVFVAYRLGSSFVEWIFLVSGH